MAIDSRAKRQSVAGVARKWRPGAIVPDATIDGSDRQTAGNSYSGIAANNPGGGSAKGIVFRSPVFGGQG